MSAITSSAPVSRITAMANWEWVDCLERVRLESIEAVLVRDVARPTDPVIRMAAKETEEYARQVLTKAVIAAREV
jgi:hypothetical protein